MNEYISREEAIKELREVYENEYPTASGDFDEYASHDVPNVLRNIPAADVQPVKRGRWIISNIYAQCSECSVAYDLDTFQRLIPMNENVPRHCSYCGADMRGGAENDT